MRRRHNVIAATLLIVGIVFLSARRESDLGGYDIWSTSDQDRGQAGGHVPARSQWKLDPDAHPVTTSLPSQETLPSLDDDDQPELPGSSRNPLSQSHTPEAQVDIPAPQVSAEPVLAIPAQGQDIAEVSKPEFSFQNDLDLELPESVLKDFRSVTPLHYGEDKTYAYTTFMATRNPSVKDPYYLAIHSLVHRVLWSPQSRTNKYPFIVFVADFVTQKQRDLLSGAGAIVRELAPVPWHCDKPGVQKRWTDLFAKLNMWAETDFQRLIFLDADAFPLTNIDGMFDLTPPKECVEHKIQLDDFLPDRSPVCEPFIFAGVPQDQTPSSPNINVGSMVFTPSLRMHKRLMQNYLKYDKYDCAMAEQAFLNWQFSPEGAFPSTSLERKWGGFFPQDGDEGKLNVVHEKIWAFDGWLKREWRRGWEEMVQFYKSEGFAKVRGAQGVR